MTTQTMPAGGADLAAMFPDEVVTKCPVRDITLPGGAGTLALITLDNGFDHTRPNTFGPNSLAALRTAVEGIAARAAAGEIVAAAVTGKPFIFAVGADLSGVPKVTERDQAMAIASAGHAVFAAFSDLPVPTFAFVNGAAMGGGVELALAASYRTISAGVPAVALPECFLGLVPGWGGCYLLPRLVGAQKALTVIIENALSQNRMLKGPQAFELGIADVMFEAADFLEESVAWAAKVVSGAVTVERVDHTADAAAWDEAVTAAKAVADLVRRKRVSSLKVYVDSPMANKATRITLAHQEVLDPETRELIAWQEAHPEKMKVEFVADVERSKALNNIRSGAVIISASGMCEAGRIKYHLRENLPRSECSILITGFQAAGSLGRRLVDGARLVRIFGQQVPVRARIYTVGGLSAHADQKALLDWLGGFHQSPGQTFVVHGESSASTHFVQAIEEKLGWSGVRMPQPGESVTL